MSIEPSMNPRKSNDNISLDWWSKNSLSFLAPLFSSAKSLIRIATGYFSIEGYNLAKPYFQTKALRILVGYDERSREAIRDKLIDEIMDDLSKWHENRREAVEDLVHKLRQGNFRLIDARTRRQDHAKVYIIDSTYVVTGSTNFTRQGLLHNWEADSVNDATTAPERVEFWCNCFETFWNAEDTYDISQDLLERLEEWLKLRDPWDIYLKTIQILIRKDDLPSPRSTYKMPCEFQVVVVQRALRQLEEHKGAMIVASTGLGKTVMATHIAYELRAADKILNVLVLSPKPVKEEWEQRMRSAGLNCAVFTMGLLDYSEIKTRKVSALTEILQALNAADDKWLVVIDESQYYRNRESTAGEERKSFTRLTKIIKEKKCLVLLLTATPYATDIDNINHQLLLLPHTNPQKHGFPEFEEVVRDDRAWKVNQVEDLINLPVGTVINTPYVAQNFAASDVGGDYILFGDQRQYFPKIQLYKVSFSPVLVQEISQIFDTDCFQHRPLRIRMRGNQWRRTQESIEEKAWNAWESSPVAFQEVLEKTIKGEYEVEFVLTQAERTKVLTPVLQKLKKITGSRDVKLKNLLEIIKKFHSEKHKILIFTERLATAVYLEEWLSLLLPHIRIANTVKRDQNSTFSQKDFGEIRELIVGFAPQSNQRSTISEDKYDVFITTDAYGQGINLQDATVAINYDLAWTADTIIQRAGRILRFRPQPQWVHLFSFACDQKTLETAKMATTHRNRFVRLMERSIVAQKFSEVPIIAENGQRIETLRGLSSLKVESLGQVAINQIEDRLLRREVSPFLAHLTVFRRNERYAKIIPNDISSALAVTGIKTPHLYVLLDYNKKPHWMICELQSQKIVDLKEDELLNWIQCSEETSCALIKPNDIEEYRRACIELWCRFKGIDKIEQSKVQHICTLFLVPK